MQLVLVCDTTVLCYLKTLGYFDHQQTTTGHTQNQQRGSNSPEKLANKLTPEKTETSNQSSSKQDHQQQMNIVVPCFFPIPVPIPIPLPLLTCSNNCSFKQPVSSTVDNKETEVKPDGDVSKEAVVGEHQHTSSDSSSAIDLSIPRSRDDDDDEMVSSNTEQSSDPSSNSSGFSSETYCQPPKKKKIVV